MFFYFDSGLLFGCLSWGALVCGWILLSSTSSLALKGDQALGEA